MQGSGGLQAGCCVLSWFQRTTTHPKPLGAVVVSTRDMGLLTTRVCRLTRHCKAIWSPCIWVVLLVKRRELILDGSGFVCHSNRHIGTMIDGNAASETLDTNHLSVGIVLRSAVVGSGGIGLRRAFAPLCLRQRISAVSMTNTQVLTTVFLLWPK
ncbi:unnamed protein product [Ostreobium quekettii]|uniref:Uncharacterized protein n=1 Tax=Ostreobium quekettii TaxID=121088 RepID=A0A8S1J277_9CHLO|nr:unnamed protein product [Ostreobium quekettii]|eukprot:evm.model.scf_891.6 EVM.evm.TU.scf_891.6   scf_891:54806-55270(-)